MYKNQVDTRVMFHRKRIPYNEETSFTRPGRRPAGNGIEQGYFTNAPTKRSSNTDAFEHMTMQEDRTLKTQYLPELFPTEKKEDSVPQKTSNNNNDEDDDYESEQMDIEEESVPDTTLERARVQSAQLLEQTKKKLQTRQIRATNVLNL